MNIEFWLERWTKNEIGFHQRSINSYLVKHWPTLDIERDRAAFVPLCGKSLDMRWLSEAAGHPVVGVEIARNACTEFFTEWNVTPTVTRAGSFERFGARAIEILCGDFFQLDPERVRGVGGVFDRAALIALPPPMRARYAAHLQSIIPAGTPILLVAPEYAQEEMSGPPFAVDEAEIRELFAARRVDVLECVDVTNHADNARFRERGLTRLIERVCRII